MDTAAMARRGPSLRWALGAAAAALGVLVVALLFGGGRPVPAPPGIPDAGPGTGWGLPVLRLAADALGVLTVGQLLAVGLLLPAPQGRLLASGLRSLRATVAAALAWAAVALAELAFNLSDLTGRPLAEALSPEQLVTFVRYVPQAQALAVQAALALLVAVVALRIVSPGGAAAALALAVMGIMPPALAGHSSASGDHMLAVPSLTVHLVATALWVGGLVALASTARHGTGVVALAVPRFSRLALWCVVAVGVSGLVNAAVRIQPLSALVTSRYGLLVVAKAAALGGLAAIGWAHRRHTLPALLRDRAGRAFARLAAVEVTVMAATLGLAVALARTPPPVDQSPDLSAATPARVLLGYDLPPAPTAWRLLFDVRVDGFAVAAAAIAIALYVSGTRSLRRRGIPWSPGRTLAWVLGWVLVLVATSSGLGRYAPVLFSVHMAQHMILNMAAPLLLVLGAPVSLALRALPNRSARDGSPGPREWLVGLLHSRVLRVIGHPLVATGIFIASLYGLYFTPLFEAAMRSHFGHLLMTAHFLAAGLLFFWVLVGTDPTPYRLPHPARLGLLLMTMSVHAFFGVALLSGTTVLAEPYFAALGRTWGTSPLTDQHLGGGIAWAFGEVPITAVLIALLVQWVRADERDARRVDRAAGTSRDSLAAYNDWLAALDRSGRSTQARQPAASGRSGPTEELRD